MINGTIAKRFEDMSIWSSNILSYAFIKFLFHYLELKSRKLLNQFFNNVCFMRGKEMFGIIRADGAR